MRLSSKQRQTLIVLRDGERERCAYPGLHMGTLASLEAKGLVVSKRGLGSIAMPHTAIKWRITDSGRAALSE